MFLKSAKLAAVAATLFATAASAESIITVNDAYARSSGMSAMAGAAFMVITNTGDTDDQLIDARSDISAKVELHTHIMEDGIAKMRQVEGGFPIPAGSEHVLQRGADHVMFMGLNGAMEQGDIVTVTLVFREAGEITVDIPVDLERQPQGGQMNQGQMDHSNMGHSNMNN